MYPVLCVCVRLSQLGSVYANNVMLAVYFGWAVYKLYLTRLRELIAYKIWSYVVLSSSDWVSDDWEIPNTYKLFR